MMVTGLKVNAGSFSVLITSSIIMNQSHISSYQMLSW